MIFDSPELGRARVMRAARLGDDAPAVPDASCSPLDEERNLWGASALARAQSRDAATPLENEAFLLRTLRKKVGPFADQECLRAHLRAARGKLHWSANGYFREAVTTVVIPTTTGRSRRDFEPKPLGRDQKGGIVKSKNASSEMNETSSTGNVPSLPPLAWETILARVSLADAVRIARVNPCTREAAGSNTVWRAQFVNRWGANAAESLERRAMTRRENGNNNATTSAVVPCFDDTPVHAIGGEGYDGSSGLPAPEVPPQEEVQEVLPQIINYHDEYRARHVRDLHLTCPECLTAKVTPMVYGFPSPALVTAMRAGTVLLGGDYLVEGNPTWACRACQSRWRSWPFSWPDRSVLSESEIAELDIPEKPGSSGLLSSNGDLDRTAPVPQSEPQRLQSINNY